MTPYHAALDTPLIRFGSEPWRIRDAAEGTAIWGAPGSGKTSGSGQTIAKAMLAAGMGGVVLCAKVDEAKSWRRYVQEAGRGDDLIVVDETAAHRFNFLDYAAQTIARPGFEQNLTHLMARMAEAARIADDSGGSDGDNRFFVDSALQWVSHAFPLLQLAYGSIRLRDLDRFIKSIPQQPGDVTDANIGSWTAQSFCGQTHLLAGERFRRANGAAKAHAKRLIDEHGEFFITTVPRLDNRPRSSIEATLSNLIFPFLTGKLADLFCADTTVTPPLARDGKIILLDLPVLRYGAAGAIGQTLFKYLFGMAMQGAPVDDRTRPVFLYADEAQFFLNSADAELLSTARSSRICVVYLTQDLPTYHARLGRNAHAVAESILSKFGTRIFHANGSIETNRAAADAIGRVEKFHIGRSISRGRSAGGGGSRHDAGGNFHGNDSASIGSADSATGYLDYELPPDYFATGLRTGAKLHRYKVDGIVVRNGRIWDKTKRHWIKAEFDQRCRAPAI